MARYQLKGDLCSCTMARLAEELARSGISGYSLDRSNKIIEAADEWQEQLELRVSSAAPGCGLQKMEDSRPPFNPLAPKNQAHEVIILIFSSCMLALGLIAEPDYPVNLLVLLMPYLICGAPVIRKASSHLLQGKFFNEFTLMSAATLAALALGQMTEALAVMLFYQIGEFFQEKAAEHSRGSIKALLAAKPPMAQVLEDGHFNLQRVEAIAPCAVLLVPAGEIIPLDGIVLDGQAQVDTSPLTGEAMPRSVSPGDRLLAGSICLHGHLTMRSTASFKDTQLAKILQLVEQAEERKSKVERFVSRLSAVYTPLIFALALLLALLPPLLGFGDFRTWFYRALVLLVISCPCALLISIPLGYFAGIGAAARQGILVKGGYVLDALRQIKAVAFDKTGTLTQGTLQASSLHPAKGFSEHDLLYSALLAQSGSNHPLARAIRRKERVLPESISTQEIPGQGVIAQYNGCRYLAGKQTFLEERGVATESNAVPAAVVYVARDEQFQGSIVVSDCIKPSASRTIAQLRAMGLKTYMLSGDHRESAAWVAWETGLDDFRAGLLPAEKVEALEEMAGLGRAMFVGDGINDAPLLAASRVSLAMGGLGSSAAIEAADAVILNDDPAKVAVLLKLAASTRRIIWQNIIFAFSVKALIMVLGIAGLAGMWAAVFADSGVALLAVLNATRMLRRRETPAAAA